MSFLIFPLLKFGTPVVGLLAGENYLRGYLPALYEASPLISAVPKSYAGVLLVNAIGSSLVLLTLGGKVGMSRADFIEKAKKDGDSDAEARYSYPKLYAEGFNALSKRFNCIQRGHQQALETYPSFLTLSLIGGIKFPVTVTIGGLLWAVARLKWAEGYATGEPSQRYSNALSFGIWVGLIIQLFAAGGTIASIAGLL